MTTATGLPRPLRTLKGALESDARSLSRRTSGALDAMLTQYGTTGEPLDVSFRELVGPLSAGDLTHSIYPYPGRLLRQIPRFFLHCDQLVMPGGAVLDPFCGSGTVLVESHVAGISSWGVDSNPFARLLSRVKTEIVKEQDGLDGLTATLRQSKAYRSAAEPDVVNLALWFSPEARYALSRLYRSIAEASLAQPTRDLLAVTLALTAERSSLRDPRIPVPVRRRDWEAAARAQTRHDVWALYERVGRNIIKKVSALPHRLDVSTLVEGTDAANLRDTFTRAVEPRLGTVGLILTSPPYGAAQKYIRSSSLAIGWSGLAPARDLPRLERGLIGREHIRVADRGDLTVPLTTIENDVSRIAEDDVVRASIYAHYFRDMDKALAEAVALLTPGGHVVLIAGANIVAGVEVQTHLHLRDIAARYGLDSVLVLRDKIRGRALLTKRANAHPPLRHETIHILRKAS